MAKLDYISLDVAVTHLATAEETLLTIANVETATHGAHVRHAPVRQSRDHGSLRPDRRGSAMSGEVFFTDTVRGRVVGAQDRLRVGSRTPAEWQLRLSGQLQAGRLLRIGCHVRYLGVERPGLHRKEHATRGLDRKSLFNTGSDVQGTTKRPFQKQRKGKFVWDAHQTK